MANVKKRSVRPLHPQIKIDIRGGEVEVDAAIAPLVTALSELPEIMTSSVNTGVKVHQRIGAKIQQLEGATG